MSINKEMIVKELNVLVDEVRKEAEVERMTDDVTDNDIKMYFDRELTPVITFSDDECCYLEGMSW